MRHSWSLSLSSESKPYQSFNVPNIADEDEDIVTASNQGNEDMQSESERRPENASTNTNKPCSRFSEPTLCWSLSLTGTCQSVADPACTHYLSYYVGHLSKLLVMVDTASNPLRDTIIPRMTCSSTLLKAVCAVSACHLSQRSDNSFASRDGLLALKYYSQVLSSLAGFLTDHASIDRYSADIIVLTTAFLCKYEIIRGSTREWRHHLIGLMQLVKGLAMSPNLSIEVRRFIQSFIIYHHEVAKITSCSRKDSDAISESIASIKQNTTSEAEEPDAYMGFTERIVEIFGRISRLSNTDGSAVMSKAEEIYQELQSWKISDTAYTAHHGVSASDLHYLRCIAEAFHSAAIIYYVSMTESLPHLRGPTASSKYDSISRCFDALCQIPDGMACESALILPLFVMGCESDFPAQQAYAIQRLRGLETSVGLGNINRARIIAEQVKADASSRYQVTEVGPRWSRATDNLGWDLIVT